MNRLLHSSPRPERGAVSRTLLVLLLVAALVVAGAVGAYLLTGDDGGSDGDPTPAAQGAPAGLERFYTQQLDWEDCGDDRCAWVEVPVDYEEPDGETTRLRMRRIEATGDGGRVLFVNPGGPGGSAVDFAGSMTSLLPEDVRDVYDIVGVDPRGVGESEPIDCLDDAAFDAYLSGGSDPDPDDAEEVERLREETRTFGAGCRERSGALAEHVSTAEAARDMDVTRALLGQSELDWFGASYGTQLGATYATLFPENVGRMVLDGAVDPALDGVESSLGQARGFQLALEAYIDSCVELASCPLGQDADAALDRMTDLLDSIEAEPLPTDQDGRELTAGLAFYGVAVTLYDQATWTILTQALGPAIEGDGSVLLRLSDLYFTRQPDGSYQDNIGEVISVVSCLDQSERLTLEETVDLLPEFEDASPVFGRPLGWGSIGCTDIGLEATNPQVEIDAAGAPPIVVIGTTRDPATPYENAGRLADQLGEDVGVLLTREGDGHTAYSSGNRCIAEAVDTFLLDGTPPEDGLTCAEE